MNIIAPYPKKPTSMPAHSQDELDEACFELRQILQQPSGYRHYCPRLDDSHLIPRTNNPLPMDSSFVPNQAHRPRSLSVGDSRPLINLVH